MLRLARCAATAATSVTLAVAIAATAAACGGRPRVPDGPLEPAKPVSIELTTAAQLVGKGFISTEHTEVRMTIDPTGTIALWGSTNRPGAPGSYDLWMARRTKPGAPWSEALPVPFNTPAKEFDPAFSPDGRELYFFSDRPGGRGGDDIYRVSFDGNTFGPVEALGPEINSPGNEWAPALSPDNSTLLFASNGRGGAGRQDLFFNSKRPEDAAGGQDLYEIHYKLNAAP